jgi:hypothetical protein
LSHFTFVRLRRPQSHKARAFYARREGLLSVVLVFGRLSL